MIRTIKTIVFIATFIGCHFFMKYLWGSDWSAFLFGLDQDTGLIRKPAIWAFLYGTTIICGYLLFRNVGWAEILGVKLKGSWDYFIASVVCCLPMCLGYAYLSTEINASVLSFVLGAVYPGFLEEIIFRALVFGVLFRFCRLGFVPAALFSAIVFGLGHMYQGNDLLSSLATFGITAIAGTWFAWLYCECDYRIWFPLWMHIIMNAAYNFFGMSGGAVGELDANLFKAMAIILSLVYVQMLVRKGKPRAITGKNLWINHTTPVTKSVIAYTQATASQN